MAFDYAEIADLSLELLTEFGQDVTRVAYSTDMYADLDGEAGSYISTGDSAAYPTGDSDIRVRVAANGWTPGVPSAFTAKFGAPGQRSYIFKLETSGAFTANFSLDGTNVLTNTSTVTNNFANGTVHWVRWTRVAATGVHQFFKSDTPTNDSALVTWAQFGNDGIGDTNTGSLFDSNVAGSVGATGQPANELASKIYRASIYNGIDGTLAVDYNANDYDTGLTQTSSATSEVWAYNGGVIVPGYNPATGIAPLRTDSTTRKGALFSFGDGETYVRGQQVEISDKRLLVDAEAGVNLKDHFIVDSVEYTIVSVDEVSPAGIVVLYDLHLRAG